MYLGNMSGYGTSDFNKALKGTNVAAIEKGLAFQEKQLSKRKPKDTKGIANDMAQIAAAKARLAQLQADPGSKAILTSAPVPISVAQSSPQVVAASTVPAVLPSPAPVAQAPVTVSPIPQVAPPAPSVAPPAASDSVTPPIIPSPSNFFSQLPASSNFPTILPQTAVDSPSAAAGDAPAQVATPDNKTPYLIGAAALAVAVFVFFGRKKR